MFDFHVDFKRFLTGSVSPAMMGRNPKKDPEKDSAHHQSSFDAQHFMRIVFVPSKKSHESMSRFITHETQEELYDSQDSNHSLSAPVAVIDVGGKKEDAEKLADSLNKKLKLESPPVCQEISEFRALSEIYPDVPRIFIAAVFKDEAFFRPYNKMSIDLAQEDPNWKKGSVFPEFKPNAYRPFITIGRFEGRETERPQLVKKLTNNLRLNPQTITFEALVCEVFQFDFEKYLAGVILENSSLQRGAVTSKHHLIC